MATWREIGIDNFQAAQTLYEARQYRSSVSRFYYAAFIVLTDELIQRGAAPEFRDNRATPSHAQLPRLVQMHFNQMSATRRSNLVSSLIALYADRIAADYSRQRVDKRSARTSFTTATRIFDYLEVRL